MAGIGGDECQAGVSLPNNTGFIKRAWMYGEWDKIYTPVREESYPGLGVGPPRPGWLCSAYTRVSFNTAYKP